MNHVFLHVLVIHVGKVDVVHLLNDELPLRLGQEDRLCILLKMSTDSALGYAFVEAEHLSHTRGFAV